MSASLLKGEQVIAYDEHGEAWAGRIVLMPGEAHLGEEEYGVQLRHGVWRHSREQLVRYGLHIQFSEVARAMAMVKQP